MVNGQCYSQISIGCSISYRKRVSQKSDSFSRLTIRFFANLLYVIPLVYFLLRHLRVRGPLRISLFRIPTRLGTRFRNKLLFIYKLSNISTPVTSVFSISSLSPLRFYTEGTYVSHPLPRFTPTFLFVSSNGEYLCVPYQSDLLILLKG